MSLDNRPEDTRPIASAAELLPYFTAGERPAPARKIGLEHEKLTAFRGGWEPVPYEGPRGIHELLMRARRYGFELYLDEGQPIAGLLGPQTLSLEPGGQVELSGAVAESSLECAEEHVRHFARLKALSEELGISFVALGYRPFGTTSTQPWMPKSRYALMREYLPKKGRYALDMMLMTASVQASADFESEADLSSKMRAAGSASPLLAALYANSPIVQGKDSGYLSFRYHLWRDVDPDRTGLLPFFFDGEGFTYRRYLDWVLDAPMFFIRRHHHYLAMNGMTFRQFLEKGAHGERATYTDFEDHMTTVFPEVRVKKVIEVRSPDCVDLRTSHALPALLRGLLYDKAARETASSLLAHLTADQRRTLQEDVARRALKAEIPSKVGGAPMTVQQASLLLLDAVAGGLNRIGAEAELPLLEPLREIATTGRTHAERALEAFKAGGPEALLQLCLLR